MTETDTTSKSGEKQFLRGSAWLVAGTATISVGSFLFWLFAARTGTKEAVGGASAMFTAAFLLSLASSPGIVVAVSRYASRATIEETSLFGWALALSCTGAMVGSAAFVLLAPDRLAEPLLDFPIVMRAALLGLLVAGLSVSALVDVALMGRRRWPLLFVRHLLITAVRLVPFPLLGDHPSSTTLFLLATAAFGVTGLPLLPLVLRSDGGWVRLGAVPPRWSDAVRFGLANAVGQLAIQGTALLAPLLVLAWVTSETFADFYLAWGFMSVVFATIQLLGQTLLVEGSRVDAPRVRQLRLALVTGLALTIVASIVSIPFRWLIPILYGERFEAAADLLVPLLLGTIPWSVTIVALTEARLRADNRMAMVIAVSFAALVLAGVSVGTEADGINGAALGWLIASAAAAMIAVAVFRAGSNLTESLHPRTVSTNTAEVPGP